MESSPNLYWGFVGRRGYDQWASGSATALFGVCGIGLGDEVFGAAPRRNSSCSTPTGSSSGWAVSEYLSSNTLPSGRAVLHFNGAGSATFGNSQASPIGTDPFVATTPANVCDYGEHLHPRDGGLELLARRNRLLFVPGVHGHAGWSRRDAPGRHVLGHGVEWSWCDLFASGARAEPDARGRLPPTSTISASRGVRLPARPVSRSTWQ